MNWRNPRYLIRGTIKNLEDKAKIKFLNEKPGSFEMVEIVPVDLSNQQSLDEAIEGCDFIVHTASTISEWNAYLMQLPQDSEDNV